jgi:hypothetical protein
MYTNTSHSIRMQLKIIRTMCTTPSTLLPNNETAGYTAHMYLSNYNLLRNQQKQNRLKHERKCTPKPNQK